MTKFEEEFKALTSWDWINVDLIQQILTKFGNWHSDEEFQELLEQNAELTRENNIVNQINSKLESQIIGLKSQLKQQALPVVPSFVADWYEFHMNGTFSAVVTAYAFAGDDKAVVWLGENGGMDLLCKMKLYGFKVEKPQLFYLKNKLTTSYLALDINTGYYEHWGEEIIPKLLNKQGYKTSFTKQEIDSMETGSYELVPVEDGE